MDTRNKIVGQASRPVPAEPIIIVTAYFDLLSAALAGELKTIRARAATLIAFILPLESQLHPQRARAELAAALRVIDYVVIGDQADLDKLIFTLHPSEVVRLEASDARRRGELVAHVQRRQIR